MRQVLKEPEFLTPAAISRAIELFRLGEAVLLICHRRLEAFSPSSIYPIRKVVGGIGLEVLNDNNETIVLNEDDPRLTCFIVAEGQTAAEALSGRMKKAYLGGLTRRVSRLMEKTRFDVGQAVQWKPNMMISTMPAPNQPAIVVEVLDSPQTDPGRHLLDPMRTVSCDMVIAFDSDEGILITTLADSRRFELCPYQEFRLPKEAQADPASLHTQGTL